MDLRFERITIWTVAHLWHGVDPNITNTPSEVKDKLQMLTEAICHHELHVFSKNKFMVKNANDLKPDLSKHNPFSFFSDYLRSATFKNLDSRTVELLKKLSLNRFDVNERFEDYQKTLLEHTANFYDFSQSMDVFRDLKPCYEDGDFDKTELEYDYLDKEEIFFFCIKRNLSFPEFWFKEDELLNLLYFISDKSLNEIIKGYKDKNIINILETFYKSRDARKLEIAKIQSKHSSFKKNGERGGLEKAKKYNRMKKLIFEFYEKNLIQTSFKPPQCAIKIIKAIEDNVINFSSLPDPSIPKQQTIEKWIRAYHKK